MRSADPHPFSLEVLLAYLLGELDGAEEGRVEGHYFECEACARRLDTMERLAAGIRDALRKGLLGGSVTADVLDRAAADGLTLRQYALRPGDSVNCTAAPADDFVVVRLAGPFYGATEAVVEVATEDLTGGAAGGHSVREVTVDRVRDEIVMIFPGDTVRAYPRSRWTMNVAAGTGPNRQRLGPYVMRHTPWEHRAADPEG